MAKRLPNTHSPEEVRKAFARVNDEVDNVTAAYVPYTGATTSVDLGSQSITTTGDAFANELTLTDDLNAVNVVLSGYITAYAGANADGEILYWDTGDGRFNAGDHGDIAGLADDDHPQYPLKTGWDVTAFNEVTMTVTDGTRTVAIEPTGADAFYWIGGVKYTFSSEQSVVFDDTEGTWYIYFDGATLTASQTAWTFNLTKAFVGLLYWDAANNASIGWSPELHSWAMTDKLHEYLHESFGARWVSGLAVTESAAGDTLDVGIGEIYDEDIECHITDGLGSGWWDQALTPLSCPIYYRSGASGLWRKVAASTVPVYLDTNVPQINLYTGGSWVLQDVSVAKYFVYWVVSSTNSDYPIFLVPGQVDDGTLADAQDHNTLSGMDFGGLPSAEQKVISRVIMQRSGSSPYYSIEEFADYRTAVDEPGAAATINSHDGLTGLNDDDHAQYILVTGTRAFTGVVGGITPTAAAHLTRKDYVDGVATAHLAAYNHANFVTAYGWGDHSGVYDVTGTAAAGDAAHLAAYNHANFVTAYGWGDHDGLYDAAGTAATASAAAVAAHESTYAHDYFGTVVVGVYNIGSAGLTIGQPVYLYGSSGHVKRAKADAIATARVHGLIFSTSIAISAWGLYATDNHLTATTAQWDAVTGESGGLTRKAVYYLSAATAGMLTTTPPSTVGQYVVEIGYAQTETMMVIGIKAPIGL